MMIPKNKPVRSIQYRKHIASQPCRACNRDGTQAAHIGHSSMAMKGGDDLCVPLCPDCHRDFDTDPRGKEKWWMQKIAIPEAKRAYGRWLTHVDKEGGI